MTYFGQIPLWKKAPFTRLLFPLMGGIITGKYFDIPALPLAIAGFALILLLFYFSIRKASVRFAHASISGVAVMLLVYLSGIALFNFHDIRKQQEWYGHSLNTSSVYMVRVSSAVVEKPKSFKVEAQVVSAFDGRCENTVKGKTIIYLAKDSNAYRISYGDVLIIKNKLKEVENPASFLGFDYRNFLANQQIYHQAYLRGNDWVPAGRKQLTALEIVVSRSLSYINHVFETHLKDGQVTALARALLTGDRTELDKDLVQAYSNAGVVHIMAISGLHLGLIYLLLLKVAEIIPLLSRSKTAKAIVILGGIWFFAIMTGGSPSVMRAAVMFSGLHLGRLINRRVPTYNFWSASAFLLLIFKPLLLWNVGFQLSYMAVLGILVVQKPVYRWLEFRNKMVDYSWQLVSVSIAAQLFTLPLCIYYFHQFPMLFLVANLVAIPLASVGLWSAVILVLSAQIPLIPQLLGRVVSRIFEWLNDFIIYIDSFTFTVWGDIHFNLWESYMMGGIVLFILVWLMRKTTTALKAALVCCILFLSAQWFSPPYVPQNESEVAGKQIETSSTPSRPEEILTSNAPLRP